ncbi:MAG: ligase-associated DNA damage response exonuclease [bacterium]|nr:ligase-associated DNA damage response exonuclease [bacterium]
MTTQPLIMQTPHGFYCPPGDFYIDPWQPVPRALVTHAHGDHCTWGCESYLVAAAGATVFRTRLGPAAHIEHLPYGEPIRIRDVTVSFHPAGHILGSAQIRVEHAGEILVVSGDYKRQPDSTCAPFEPVRCHHFITEATFGLPIYHWQPTAIIFDQINRWWAANANQGKASILYVYALGKAQRVLSGLDPSIGAILCHGAVERLNRAYREAGIALPATRYASTADKAEIGRSLVLAPVSARGTTWTRRFGTHASGFASGWMRIRGARRQKSVDRGFILSDHADWDDLLRTIHETGATRIGVTHGYTAVLSRWLVDQGLDAYAIDTRYGGEADEVSGDDMPGDNDDSPGEEGGG